jgi:hypothetical protein
MSYDQFKPVIKIGAFDHRWDISGDPKDSFNQMEVRFLSLGKWIRMKVPERDLYLSC